ncbi:MAG: rod shape-determining protein [Eubacteriales bacterium]|nr:rod shape-determining protein [Eubacteriales bacterium]
MAIIAPSLGIDLGTSNTLVYVSKKAILINEPTLLIVSSGPRRTLKAIGSDARALLGRTTGGDLAIRPLQDGTVKEYRMTETILRYFIRKAIGASHIIKPQVFITIPCHVSPVERRVVREAAISAGARKNAVHLIEKPFASALGSGLPVFQPEGSMVVDIGGGTTEVALISTGGMVASRSIKMGGIKMDEAIMEFIKDDYKMLIGDRMAEDLKIDWGSALPVKEDRKVMIRGRDLVTSLPQTAEISSSKIYEALKEPCNMIVQTIINVLEKAPPELSADVLKKGIFLMGGASQLYGMENFIAKQLELPVTIAKNPSVCAAMGLGHLAENPELLAHMGTSNMLQSEEA